MQPERRVRPKVEGRVGGATCQRTFPSILANAKNLRGFGGLVPHALTNSYPFSNFTFWNSRDHTALQFTLNQHTFPFPLDCESSVLRLMLTSHRTACVTASAPLFGQALLTGTL